MYHVTIVTYLFIVQEIKKIEKKRKRKIKSKKIDKKKRKEKENIRVQAYYDNRNNVNNKSLKEKKNQDLD